MADENERGEAKEIGGLLKGRVVHYVPAEQRIPSNRPQPSHLAALIIQVLDRKSGVSNLAVFKDGSAEHVDQVSDSSEMLFRATSVPHAEDPKTPFSWHWPTRCGCR